MENKIFGNITCYKDPRFIVEYDTNFNHKQKAQIIARETGIPINLIYDDSEERRFEGVLYTYDMTSFWIKIDNKWFFIKENWNLISFFNELLGEEITKYFGLESAKYEIAKLKTEKNYKYCILSENMFNPDFNYLTLDKLKIYENREDVKRILKDIKNICKNNNNGDFSLLNDIIKMSVRDLYSGNPDRHKLNFFFKQKDGIISLAPLLDYESSFLIDDELNCSNAIFSLNLRNWNTIRLIKKENIFQESLYKLLDINMSYLLKLTQEKHNIKISKILTDFYLEKDKYIKKLIKDINIVKK